MKFIFKKAVHGCEKDLYSRMSYNLTKFYNNNK